MEKLESILEHWKKDAVIDQTEPGREIINIPLLHSKYLNMLMEHKMALKKAQFDYYRMKKLKWEYYTGKLTEEELSVRGWDPFPFTLKSDITTYLDADPDLIKLLEKEAYHKECISALETIMNELKSRTFQIRDFIVWERFVAGQ